MLNPPQDAVHLLAVLDFSIKEVGLFLRILDCFSSHIRGLGFTDDVIGDGLGSDDILLQDLCVLHPRANVVLCLLVYGMYFGLNMVALNHAALPKRHLQ